MRILAIIAAAALAATPAAAQFVSYAYDGAYEGSGALITELSAPGCPAVSLTHIDIRDGALRAWDRGRQTVKGLITHDGFFNADFYNTEGDTRLFEGTVDRNGALVGGVVDGDCAFIITLYKIR